MHAYVSSSYLLGSGLICFPLISFFLKGLEFQRRWPDTEQEGKEHLGPVPGETRRKDSPTDERICGEVADYAGHCNSIYKYFL